MAGTDEINSLNLEFCDSRGKSLCRVIENQGDYSQIITVQPFEDCPVRIQFSLYDTYPKSAPDVFVKSATDRARPSSVPEEDREELRAKLQMLAESAQGKPTLSMLVDECLAILKNKSSVKSDSAFVEKDNTERSDKPKEKLVQDAPEPVSEPSDSPPKSKMRTASDVISRILWDDKLDRSCFTVGYNDRFTGLIEEKFNAFTWDQPLSAVDNDTLAIPQHRIQYFKYKQVKVWDKNERLDLVFGSTGDGGDIYALVDQFESAVDKAKEVTGVRRVPTTRHGAGPEKNETDEASLMKWAFEEVPPGGIRLKTGGPLNAKVWIVGDSHTRSLLGCTANRIVEIDGRSVFVMSRGGAPTSVILKDATEKLRAFEGKLDCLVLQVGANDLLQLTPAKTPEDADKLDEFVQANEKKIGDWVYANAERIGSLVFVESYKQRPRNFFVQGRRSNYPRPGYPQQDFRVEKWNGMLRSLVEKIATEPDSSRRIEKCYTMETASWLWNDHPKPPSEVYNSDHFYDGIHLNYDQEYHERNSICYEPLPIRWTYALKVFQAVRLALRRTSAAE